jgi:N utilization substance protein B
MMIEAVEEPVPQEISRRKAARLAAIQALYELYINGGDVEDMIIEHVQNRPGAVFANDRHVQFDEKLFSDVVRGTCRWREQVDGILAELLTGSWSLPRLDRILRDLLACAAYELLYRKDVPARVVLNEYLDLAHAFFGEQEPGMVNRVLDRLARRARPDEFLDNRDDGRE